VPSARNSGLESTENFRPFGVGGQDGLDGIGRLHRDGSTFSTIIFRFRHARRSCAPPTRCSAGPPRGRRQHRKSWSGCDCHKDDVEFLDLPDHIGGKKQVSFRAPARRLQSRPGSKIGSVPLFQAAMRAAFMSTTVTVMSGALECNHGPSSAHPRNRHQCSRMFINKKEAGMLPASEIKTKYDLPMPGWAPA